MPERDIAPSRVCGLKGYSGAEIHRIGVAGCDAIPKPKQISRWLVAWVLLLDENQGQDKRVESIFVPCLDVGSTPTSSTRDMLLHKGYVAPQVICCSTRGPVGP